MPVIDERGRLFGRINVIDAAVAFLVLLLIPLAYGAFMLFRAPAPKILSLTPQTLVNQPGATIHLTGEDLRPFLRAQLGTYESDGFLLGSTTAAEIKVPARIPPGTYDLTLSDEAQVLARVPGAVTIAAPPVPVRRSAEGEVIVRFIVEPETANMVKVGDRAIELPNRDPARAEVVRIERPPIVTARFNMDPGPGRNLQLEQPAAILTAMFRVSLTAGSGGWTYGDAPVKVGAPFTFETTRVIIKGSIINLTVHGEAADTP
jgi:hypothetical protein